MAKVIDALAEYLIDIKGLSYEPLKVNYCFSFVLLFIFVSLRYQSECSNTPSRSQQRSNST